MHFLSLALFIGLVTASPVSKLTPRAASSPPQGAIVVDQSGSVAGSLPTVQAGVDALSKTSTEVQTLYIMAGNYTEQVYIQPLAGPLVVQGQTDDTSSYKGNKVTISQNRSRNTVAKNDDTATVRNWSTNTKFYNINLENTFGHTPTNGQALAISAQETNQGYYGMSFLGFQDTILANEGKQLYAKCYVEGVVDFIFGQRAFAWFEGADIRVFEEAVIVANGAATEGASKFVINKSNVAARDANVQKGTAHLARPWKEFSYTVFQNTELSDVVDPEGWRAWNEATPNTASSTLAEFGNTGAGAGDKSTRAPFGQFLQAPIAIEDVLGSGWEKESYVDMAYMS
ncbi:uncharacterized protein L3040_004302 [Drepanopeziza brunnea f. sp. 'multigermtubi']|uniref:uncharacterized protein n=1 Tax=Drepanopeziza brunnea f. sp. 'multigermtubi' TaxID=698441 RepID=UPI00239740A9|nr:hypothetical protein L3040_004302 [Drepanopeziza brunnea f. sp. 'multigermtubi']